MFGSGDCCCEPLLPVVAAAAAAAAAVAAPAVAAPLAAAAVACNGVPGLLLLFTLLLAGTSCAEDADLGVPTVPLILSRFVGW